MNVLHRCQYLDGNATVVEEDPQLAVYSNLFYFPGVWGLYDQGQKLVTGTGYFRGPGAPEPLGASYSRDFRIKDITADSAEPCYYFVGHIPDHYGHFLLCAMSRLWAYARTGRSIKLITYGDFETVLARNPAIAQLLGALGIGRGDFVSFDEPVRLRQVIVASPSFEETNFIHFAYLRMCREMAPRLTQGLAANPSSTPIYLAKYKLSSGVVKLGNEEEFASHLERRGVEIIFPEQLTLGEQIQLWHDRRRIAGLIGSAFHTASFVERRKLMMLNYGRNLLSNQVLIDRAVPNDAIYLYSKLGFDENDSRDGFTSIRTIRDPDLVADHFLRILDPFMDIKPTSWIEASGEAARDGINPEGPNLACHRPTRQSSVYSIPTNLSAGADPVGGVSGFLTGGYQFHTALESQPWWDVDLQSATLIGEIRIFNRADEVSERAAKFTISISLDDLTWTELYRRDVWTSYGKTSGRPLIWQVKEPILARFVRITLIDQDFLHLDQVVIFSRATLNSMSSSEEVSARTYFMTRFGQLICQDSALGLTARQPRDIDSIDELVYVDVNVAVHSDWKRQIVGNDALKRQFTIESGPLAGLVLHLLADPMTLALSKDGLFYGSIQDKPEFAADRTSIQDFEMFQRLDRQQALAVLSLAA